MSAPEWHRVAAADEVHEGQPLAVKVGERFVGLYRIGSEIYAISDVCTHQFALLSEGWVEGDVVECCLHQARFHIPTGKCLGPPADRDVETYPVRMTDGQIHIAVPRSDAGAH